MFRFVVTGVVALMIVVGAIACSSSNDSTPAAAAAPAGAQAPKGSIEATWIEPQVEGDTVTISFAEVESNWNTHFGLSEGAAAMNFMAYVLDGEAHVRANVCPPCRSVGFSLDGDDLVCDRCGTVFDASTGNGIRGACKDYPKAEVAHSIADGNIVMQMTDLTTAYQNNTEAGLP